MSSALFDAWVVEKWDSRRGGICTSFVGVIYATFLSILAIVLKLQWHFAKSKKCKRTVNKLQIDTFEEVLLKSFDCVMQTHASSALLVQTNSMVVDSFFNGAMFGRPFIMQGKSANESVRLLTHIHQLVVDAKCGPVQSNYAKPDFRTQLTRCDGSDTEVELVAVRTPQADERDSSGCFLPGERSYLGNNASSKRAPLDTLNAQARCRCLATNGKRKNCFGKRSKKSTLPTIEESVEENTHGHC